MLKAKNLYILNKTDDFVRGEMDNVALDDNAICLEQLAGRYVLYGCYTSPDVSLPPFTKLTMSWNAETPEGTVVEAQCRVFVEESWSPWLSCGKWSPYIKRAGEDGEEQKPAYIKDGMICIPGAKATRAQLRIYLYTDDERCTPLVRLLGASVLPADWQKEEAKPYGRLLRLPAYSQNLRDPQLRPYMDSPVMLTSLLNRWGQDILPEELALAMFDHGRQGCQNHSFAVAAAGTYGYEAFLAYLDPARVWEHIKAGESVALELNYAASEEEQKETGLPLLPGSFAGGKHQFMPLRGFELDDQGEIYALVNDGHAPNNRAAETRYPAKDIWEAYSGLALLVSGFHPNRQEGSPIRRHCGLNPLNEVGCYMFQDAENNELPLPEDFSGSIAAAVQDGTAWATTAHKSFVYLNKAEDGSIQLPPEVIQPGRKITVYAIGPSGSTLVGQINL